MNIAIIDPLGVPYGPQTLKYRGLGGSESAVINMARELKAIGHTVHVYNNLSSNEEENFGGDFFPLKMVEYPAAKHYDFMISSRSLSPFAPEEHRHLFRSDRGPIPRYNQIQSISKHKILWMHDTFIDGDQLLEAYVLHGFVNQVFTLSDWHTSYVLNCQHGPRRNFEVLKNCIFQTRNGIWRESQFPVDISKKDRNLFVYNASVSKGMIPLVQRIWPLVKERIPSAKLMIIGGYYKFAAGDNPDEQEQKYHQLVSDNRDPSITFTGIIPQAMVYDWLERAGFMIYPAAFPETYGISTLEALSRNTPIITCQFGALEETAIDDASFKIAYAIEPNSLFPHIDTDQQIKRFVDLVAEAWSNTYLHHQKMNACNKLRGILEWDTVALQWDYHFSRTLGEFYDPDKFDRLQIIETRLANVFNRRFINHSSKFIGKVKYNQFDHDILVVTTVRNAENYIEKCIRSVAQQNYLKYYMIIVDDASTDNTVDVAKKTIRSLGGDYDYKFSIVENKVRKGALRNQVEQITGHATGDMIVILLDGDDWLVNDPTIFSYYNELYGQLEAEYGTDEYFMTYGSCWSLADNIPLYAQEYPEHIKREKKYREHRFPWNMPYTHLRTFSAGTLLHNMTNARFLIDGKADQWPMAGGDAMLFYFLLDHLDPDHVIPVSYVTMVYNDTNPNNDYKINSEEQTRVANYVLGVKNENKGPNRNSYRAVRRTTNF